MMMEIVTCDPKLVLEFEVDQRSLGKELFDQVTRAIGLRETWYFGLQYYDSKGYVTWLKMDKRICDQDVPLSHDSCHNHPRLFHQKLMSLKSSPSGSTSSTTSVAVAAGSGVSGSGQNINTSQTQLQQQTSSSSNTSLNNVNSLNGVIGMNGFHNPYANNNMQNNGTQAGPSSKTSSTSSVSTATSSTSGQSNLHNTVNGLMASSRTNLRSIMRMSSSLSTGIDMSKKGRMVFLFEAKFFPEDVAEELIQEVTQRMFYLQVKSAILSMEVFCPPEAAVLLASYAVQAKFGDYDLMTYRPGMIAECADDLLPQSVINQYQMTSDMWEERIKTWYADHRGMTRDEAELEYLKIAQDLDQFGVKYFLITNKKETSLWLGVTATGLRIYDFDNQLTPKVSFTWSEIRNIAYDDKRFTIKPVDPKAGVLNFYSAKTKLNKLILELCIGYHDLFMKRRRPDSMELQQMKLQAREEKERRHHERSKLEKEKLLRETAEREKREMQEQLIQYQKEARSAQEMLRRSEELAELLSEKVRVAEEEALLLSHKSFEAETEIQRIKIGAIKSHEEKMMI